MRYDADMATVWAYRVGVWTNNPGAGWNHTLSIGGLSDLSDQMEKAKLRGTVSHLAIVAHGNAPGLVQFDHDMTAATMSHFATDLARLKAYLTADAWVTFYSCIAGKDEPGSRLLIELSKQLPGRTIVGFELFGFIGPAGALNTPGTMTAVETPVAQLAMKPNARHGNLNPWCPFAKRARDSRIVHYPILEQNGRPGKRCANPNCPGHASPAHSCSGW